MAAVSPPPAPDRPRPSARPSPGRLRLLAAGLALAVAGGAAAIGLALLIGALRTSTPVTTIIRAAPATAAPASPRAAWASVYAAADRGVVDIAARRTSSTLGPAGARQEEMSLGSGFILDGRGDILTAEHVVSGASSIRVTLRGGARRTAAVVATDPGSDVAVVHVDPAGLTLEPLPLGSSEALAAGDPLALIGDPLGFARSLSTGVVSAIERTMQAPNGYQIADAIQTDAAMNPGNSGGPLLNTRGQVVGIADQIATGTDEFGAPSGTQTSTGVGFAVPIDLIRSELPALESGHRPTHAYLGVAFTPASNGAAGAVIARVQPRTPAARAGLRAGDEITAVGDDAVRTEADLIAALAAAHPGQRVPITVRRGSGRVTVTATLGARP